MKRSSANPDKTLGGIDSYATSQDQFAAEPRLFKFKKYQATDWQIISCRLIPLYLPNFISEEKAVR
jgi:hypothetical protein